MQFGLNIYCLLKVAGKFDAGEEIEDEEEPAGMSSSASTGWRSKMKLLPPVLQTWAGRCSWSSALWRPTLSGSLCHSKLLWPKLHFWCFDFQALQCLFFGFREGDLHRHAHHIYSSLCSCCSSLAWLRWQQLRTLLTQIHPEPWRDVFQAGSASADIKPKRGPELGHTSSLGH